MVDRMTNHDWETHLPARCPRCGRFIVLVDRLVSEASDWRVEAAKRHVHVPRSHKPRGEI